MQINWITWKEAYLRVRRANVLSYIFFVIISSIADVFLDLKYMQLMRDTTLEWSARRGGENIIFPTKVSSGCVRWRVCWFICFMDVGGLLCIRRASLHSAFAFQFRNGCWAMIMRCGIFPVYTVHQPFCSPWNFALEEDLRASYPSDEKAVGWSKNVHLIHFLNFVAEVVNYPGTWCWGLWHHSHNKTS